VGEPLRDHKRPELIRRIREKYKEKGIVEKGVNLLPALIVKGKKKPKFQTVNFTFNYEFNEKEIIEKAEQLADARIECNKIEEEKKMVTSDFKAKIDAKQAAINMLAGHIQNGFEKITKACQMTKDFNRGLKFYFYEGKNVGEEKLTAHDYQLQADFEEGKRTDTNDPE